MNLSSKRWESGVFKTTNANQVANPMINEKSIAVAALLPLSKNKSHDVQKSYYAYDSRNRVECKRRETHNHHQFLTFQRFPRKEHHRSGRSIHWRPINKIDAILEIQQQKEENNLAKNDEFN